MKYHAAVVMLLPSMQLEKLSAIRKFMERNGIGTETSPRYVIHRNCGRCNTAILSNRTRFCCPYCGKKIKA
ncbi:MAG: hypothetical protein HYW91_02820 [Candidatus Sungbacteria bacterium]|nr:hypothetical protein [Candidatus Sungbacteria bacterium]